MNLRYSGSQTGEGKGLLKESVPVSSVLWLETGNRVEGNDTV